MNFFKIRIPGESVVGGCSADLIENLDSNILATLNPTIENGFIYSEFKEHPEIYLIPAENSDFYDSDLNEWSHINDNTSGIIYPFVNQTTTRDSHIDCINKIKARTLQWVSEGYPHSKVIASRVSRELTDFSPSEIFRSLCSAYPQACVFIFSTPLHGTWIGASPEIILTSSDNSIRTLSLAGTRWNNRQLENATYCSTTTREWDSKNLEEQQIVTDFILSSLKTYGLNPIADGPHTMKAGPVEHLATRITAEGRLRDFSLLRQLCPTPALSGYPRKESIETIQNIEKFPRQCYGGLIGLLKANGDFFTYANLRSGRFDTPNHSIELHAGGGITPKSNPDIEWEETEKKLSTLRKIIRKI